jgi:uncharacterized protein (DUF58 family)
MAETTTGRRFLQRDVSDWRSEAADFGKSLLLLGLALFAALYANTSARNGQIPAAILGAVLALAVALWVTWRFVPRLAAAVAWEWLPFLSGFEVTREGWAGVALTGLTALNTSNNLLYMIFSALFATLLISVFLAGINVLSLNVQATVPPECFARKSFPMTVTIRNGKAVFPTFSTRIGSDDARRFRFASSYFAIIGARCTESVTVESACGRRGLHPIGNVRVESRYPFGFFTKSYGFPVDGECVVFPEITEASVPARRALHSPGSAERFDRGQGVDLYLIRDYQTTDSARRVDWKASAKTSVLKTREFAAEDTRRVAVVLDRYGRPGDEARFEELVSRAASLVVHLAGSDAEVGLLSDDWISDFGSGEKVQRSILRYLALVEMSSAAARVHNTQGGETFVLSLR